MLALLNALIRERRLLADHDTVLWRLDRMQKYFRIILGRSWQC